MQSTPPYMRLPPPTRWSTPIPNEQYKDHLFGQLTKVVMQSSCSNRNNQVFLYFKREAIRTSYIWTQEYRFHFYQKKTINQSFSLNFVQTTFDMDFLGTSEIEHIYMVTVWECNCFLGILSWSNRRIPIIRGLASLQRADWHLRLAPSYTNRANFCLSNIWPVSSHHPNMPWKVTKKYEGAITATCRIFPHRMWLIFFGLTKIRAPPYILTRIIL